jgi:2-amino-4-hydroxy-6-hydroxymethyldihydropteridine diphosphokinase
VTQVYFGIGSNSQREWHINAGVKELRKMFSCLELSSVYESEAVGFKGDRFYNMAIGFDTALMLADLADRLRKIEYKYGRPMKTKVFGNRYLDIDILTFGDWNGEYFGIKLPRPEITENAYVLAPLAEIVPHRRTSFGRTSYSELWQKFDKSTQKLWKVEFPFAG